MYKPTSNKEQVEKPEQMKFSEHSITYNDGFCNQF